MTSSSRVLLDTDGPLALIRLNRPDRRNTFDLPQIAALHAALDHSCRDDAVRVVILTGSGDDFSAGYDADALLKLVGEPRDGLRAYFDALDRLLNRFATLPLITVVSAHGRIDGPGLSLLCAADVSLAAIDAEFALSDVRHGLSPVITAPWLINRAGRSRGQVIALTGAAFDGVSAHEYGIVHEVCPGDILNQCVEAAVRELLAGESTAQQRWKAAFGSASDLAEREQRVSEAVRQAAGTSGRAALAAWQAQG